VSEFQVLFENNFVSGSRAIWKFNPSSRMVFRSVQLNGCGIDNEIFVLSVLLSSISLEMVVGVFNWVNSITGGVKFTFFLLSNLMFSFWDNDTSLGMDNWIINLKVSSSRSICYGWCWRSINSFPAFAGSNNSIGKIISQGNVWESKILSTWAIW
jgi:hypothetical protein